MTQLTDRVIIVTGAVGNLGTAVAEGIHALGGRLVLVDRSSNRLQKSFAKLDDPNRHWFANNIDMMDAASVDAMAKEVKRRFGHIDGLVNTVGGFRGGKPVHESDTDELDAMLDINVRTLLNACRAVIPHMLEARRGRIVNIASRGAFAGSANYAAYSVAKTAVLRLTEAMAAELRDAGINVNCVAPGTIDTPQNRVAMPQAKHANWVSPADIANVIVFLLSDAARAISGAAVPVYGRS